MIECAMLMCPKCRQALEPIADREVVCSCGETYPRLLSSGVDFLQGAEFTDFVLEEENPEQRAILDLETAGIAARMAHFLTPLISSYARNRGKAPDSLIVLDCGCGNGLSIDLLREQGMRAWGIDAGRARHQQWQKRNERRHLISASALGIPFADASFDVVLSSGLVEHIGIHEEENGGYRSHRLSDCHRQRQQFIRELVRVLKPDGFVLLDHPNGAFPADFWHGGAAGSIRWHWPHGDMLPSFPEITAYFRAADPSLRLVSISPHRRLGFQKVGAHWYGRLFTPAMRAWLRLMDIRPLSFLARGLLNPYLVTVASRQPNAVEWIHP